MMRRDERRFRQPADEDKKVIEIKLDEIKKLLKDLTQNQRKVDQMLEAIRAQVERNKDVDASVKALLEGLKSKLDELASRETVDPAEVQALADELGKSNDELAAAVTANTPSDSNADNA